jgi:hypothetical protein
MKKLTGLFLAVFMAFSIASGQERNDVIKVYNEGAKLLQTDVQGAITAFENVVTLSEQVGESAKRSEIKSHASIAGIVCEAGQ